MLGAAAGVFRLGMNKGGSSVVVARSESGGGCGKEKISSSTAFIISTGRVALDLPKGSLFLGITSAKFSSSSAESVSDTAIGIFGLDFDAARLVLGFAVGFGGTSCSDASRIFSCSESGAWAFEFARDVFRGSSLVIGGTADDLAFVRDTLRGTA